MINHKIFLGLFSYCLLHDVVLHYRRISHLFSIKKNIICCRHQSFLRKFIFQLNELFSAICSFRAKQNKKLLYCFSPCFLPKLSRKRKIMSKYLWSDGRVTVVKRGNLWWKQSAKKHQNILFTDALKEMQTKQKFMSDLNLTKNRLMMVIFSGVLSFFFSSIFLAIIFEMIFLLLRTEYFVNIFGKASVYCLEVHKNLLFDIENIFNKAKAGKDVRIKQSTKE